MKKQGSMIFTFSSLLLLSLTKTAYAQQTRINCPESNLDRGAVCFNQGGTIVNNQKGGTINIFQTPSSQNQLPYRASVSSKNPAAQQQNSFVIHKRPRQQESLISDDR